MENRRKIVIKRKGNQKASPSSSNSPQKTTNQPKLRIHPKVNRENKYSELLSRFEETQRKNQLLKLSVFIGVPIIILVVLLVIVFSGGPDASTNANTSAVPPAQQAQKSTKLDAYAIKDEGYIDRDKSFKEFFQDYRVSEKDVAAIESLARKEGVYELKKANKYRILASKENKNKIVQFEYEPTPYRVLQFSLGYPVSVEEITKKATSRVDVSSGIIQTTFLEAINENNIDLDIMDKMVEVLKWSVDFYHVAPGDKFKVIYETELADGEVVDHGNILAIYFQNGKENHYAFLFDNGKEEQYLSYYAKPLQRQFLMSPIKYGRISSKYNLERVHPVKKVKIPHLGTDYAAKEGTEIYSVADGTVTIAGFKTNNGNYVKIKHSNVYSTQYLHMQDFAPGIKPGKRVKQGDVIGYVGSTGLATGPHVCFRFWKNGKQVDHYKEGRITKIANLNPKQMEQFMTYRSSMDSIFNQTSFFN